MVLNPFFFKPGPCTFSETLYSEVYWMMKNLLFTQSACYGEEHSKSSGIGNMGTLPSFLHLLESGFFDQNDTTWNTVTVDKVLC